MIESIIDWLKLKPFKLKAIVLTPINPVVIPKSEMLVTSIMTSVYSTRMSQAFLYNSYWLSSTTISKGQALKIKREPL